MIRKLLKIILNKINQKLNKKNFFTKIIFFVSSFLSSLKLINHNYKLIFKTKIDYKKIRFLFSLPRSGQHLLRNILYSYLEQIHGFGNGIPKITGNTTLPKERHIVYGFESNLKENLISKLKFTNLEFTKIKRPNEMNQINYDLIYNNHHPIQHENLIDFNKARGILLYRDPVKATSSMVLLYILHRMRNKKINFNNTNDFKKEIWNRSNLTIKFFNYWNELIKKNPENFIIINYDNLLNDTFNIFVKILKFYKIEFNEDLLQNSIKINSKDNLKKLKFESFRIITGKDEVEIRKNIEEIVKKYFISQDFDFKKIIQNF